MNINKLYDFIFLGDEEINREVLDQLNGLLRRNELTRGTRFSGPRLAQILNRRDIMTVRAKMLDDRIVGIGSVSEIRRRKDDYRINEFFVDKDYRKGGVMDELLERLIQHLKTAKGRWLQVESPPGNAANVVYERHRFSFDRERNTYYLAL